MILFLPSLDSDNFCSAGHHLLNLISWSTDTPWPTNSLEKHISGGFAASQILFQMEGPTVEPWSLYTSQIQNSVRREGFREGKEGRKYAWWGGVWCLSFWLRASPGSDVALLLSAAWPHTIPSAHAISEMQQPRRGFRPWKVAEV